MALHFCPPPTSWEHPVWITRCLSGAPYNYRNTCDGDRAPDLLGDSGSRLSCSFLFLSRAHGGGMMKDTAPLTLLGWNDRKWPSILLALPRPELALPADEEVGGQMSHTTPSQLYNAAWTLTARQAGRQVGYGQGWLLCTLAAPPISGLGHGKWGVWLIQRST